MQCLQEFNKLIKLQRLYEKLNKQCRWFIDFVDGELGIY